VPVWLTVSAYTIAGTVVGAIAFSILMLLLHAVFWRQALYDGQYVLGCCAAPFPFGGLTGGTTGAAWAFLQIGKVALASWVCLVGGGLEAAAALLMLVAAWCKKDEPEMTIWSYVRFLIIPAYGPPLLAAAVLLRWGIRLLQER
jgi:hypothetical protein